MFLLHSPLQKNIFSPVKNKNYGIDVKKPSVFKIENPQANLNGEVTVHYFRNGLMTKYADLTAGQSDLSDEGIFAPGIRLIITLQGRTELQFGEQVVKLNAQKRPVAALLSVTKPTWGIKRFTLGEKQRELVIFIEPEWVDNSGLNQLIDFSYFSLLQQAHLQFYLLFTNKRVLALAESLIRVEPGSMLLQHLRKESNCLALMVELLSQLPSFKPVADLSPEQQRIEQLTQMLLSGEMDNQTLGQIAKTMHTNVTTLQTHFKRIHGTSIMNYLRQIKLERAYKALLRGASVNRAAEMAGYSNPDNFTTAFRRYFKIVPSKVKKESALLFIG